MIVVNKDKKNLDVCIYLGHISISSYLTFTTLASFGNNDLIIINVSISSISHAKH